MHTKQNQPYNMFKAMDQTAYDKSIALLKRASLPGGFVAAVQEHDNYRRVWTRDGTVCSLAALLSNDATLIATAAATINTIFSHQHADGFMPSNVDIESRKASYGGIVGRADNPSWAVIGLCSYTLFTNDHSLAQKYRSNVERCFALMNAWEFNGRHLLYVPQSGDWADEYIQHGYILFDQLLRVWALRLAARVYEREAWLQKANAITEVIRNNYWYSSSNTPYFPSWENRLATAFDGYWLMGFNPARVYRYFDLQANALALILNIGDEQTNTTCVGRIHELFIDAGTGTMLPSFYPAIETGSRDMEELLGNHAYAFRNSPHQFHNGGLWAVWNGMMSMAFAMHGDSLAAQQTAAAIHAANAKGGHAFNECLDGRSNMPCGVDHCAWSAAGAVMAVQASAGNFLITN